MTQTETNSATQGDIDTPRRALFDAANHLPHPLHGGHRTWVETNCYVDAWIELLGGLGLPPEPAGLVALSANAHPRQWSFLKYQVDDIRFLYGIDVKELHIWRGLEEHLLEHLDAGDLLTIECDAHFLPDTNGTTYHTGHAKTTIIPVAADPYARTMSYLHDAGLYTLSGDDYDGVVGRSDAPLVVPHPYVELIELSTWNPDRGTLLAQLPERAWRLGRAHLARAPHDNPATRFVTGLRDEFATLRVRGMEYFHPLSFATTRQLGLTAQNAADGLEWLARTPEYYHLCEPLRHGAEHFTDVAIAAKRLQFGIARIASGRTRELDHLCDDITRGWATGMQYARTALT